MSIFEKPVSFDKIDSLGAGLREEILRQKLSASAINLFEQPTESEMTAYIEGVMGTSSDLFSDDLGLAA